MRFKYPYIIIILFSIIIVGCKEERVVVVPSGESVKVGVIAPLSGPDKTWGTFGLRGLETAVQLKPLLNNGSTIEFIMEDDQNLPELSRKALTKLVEEDQVTAVLSLSNSESVLGLVDLADRYQTPIFSLVSTHPQITENNKYISQLLFDDYLQGTVAALFLMDELLIDHVGVLTDRENPHSLFLAKRFIEKFESLGGSVHEVEVLNNETAFEQNLAAFQNSNVEFIYAPLDADHIVTLLELLDKLGWQPQIMGSDGIAATMELQFPDKMHLANGMYLTDPYSSVLPKTNYGRQVVKTYQKQFGGSGTGIAAMGCEGTSILINALNSCQDSKDRVCVNNMLRSTQDFLGLFGKISVMFNGKSERPIFINTLQDANMKIVVKIY